MAFISSSLKNLADTIAEVDFALVAEGSGDTASALLPLAVEWPAGDLDMKNVLIDRAAYRFSLLARTDVEGARARISLPGQDDQFVTLHQAKKTLTAGDGSRWAWHALPLQCDEKPFKLAYGVVSVEVEIAAGGKQLALRSRPVPCSCTIPRLKDHVAGLLRALREPSAAAALALMSAPVDGACGGQDAGRPAESFLALAERTAGAVEAALPALKLRPFARTRPAPAVVRASSARRAGRAETQWLARNPSALVRRGNGWEVLKVATMQPARAVAVEENLAVLALCADVARQASALSRVFENAAENIESNMARMPALGAGEGFMPAQLILVEQLEIVRARQEAAAGIAARARRSQVELEHCWGVDAPRRFSLPRRSKPFQEIDCYARLYAVMTQWSREGRADVGRETALLSADSMPRLYELFCLERILSWLLADGFEAVEAQQVHYSLRSPHFQNERAVANHYMFVRGAERAEVWYQPVIYGDARDEAGLALHRTSVARDGDGDSYWTPDFVVRATSADGKNRIIAMDSKWADGNAVQRMLSTCIDKYKANIAGLDGLRADAVVLLCGRGAEADAWEQPLGSWAREVGMLPDAVCPLSAFAGTLDKVLGQLFAGHSGEQGDGNAAGAAGTALPVLNGASGIKRANECGDGEESYIEETASVEKKEKAAKHAAADRQQELDPDFAKLLLQFLQRPQDIADAQNAQLSQDIFLIEYPLVRLKKPTGADRKRYTCMPYQACGQDVYLYKHWRPNQVNRLKMAIRKWDKRTLAAQSKKR